jgi:creatinine amidohydrolase
MSDGEAAVLWAKLTWCEVAKLRQSGVDMVILPVGSTEQHGPHLALDTDTLCATAVADAVSRRTGVPVLPGIPYGCSLGHSRRWPGTLSLQPETLIALVFETLSWAHASGFRRMLILNGHVTNAAPLRCALERLRATFDDCMVAVRDVGAVSPRVQSIFAADASDWHANAAETSLVMALGPEGVREGELACADDPDRTTGLFFAHPVNRTSCNGVTGMPSRASRAQGEALFAAIVEDLAAQVHVALREEPPLAASYFAAVGSGAASPNDAQVRR